ncbi:MAG: tetratricopeptide repeat protein [Bacteriovoracaceae bacterium]|nr:tetratricopeptide repeat protein [Bacteriovoracaceae bacterium]
MRIVLLIVILSATFGCSSFSLSSRPTGILAPPEKYKDIIFLINNGGSAKARQFLNTTEIDGPYEAAWVNYFHGLLAMADKDFPKALEIIETGHSRIYHKSSDKFQRLKGRFLKKLGWLQRWNKNYQGATFLHQKEYQVFKKYGSALELHDALISLDVDAYFLKRWDLSEKWLNEALKVASDIDDKDNKLKSLAITHNNLSGTLSSLKKFEQAIQNAILAHKYWTEFQVTKGQDQSREVWATFNIGDIYFAWYQHLKVQEIAGAETYQKKSIDAYKKSLSLARKRKIKKSDILYIKKQLSKVQK